MNDIANKIKARIDLLHRLDELYNQGVPKIKDEEYDNLYFELKEWEDKYKIIYPDSPTQSIHYSVLSELSKVTHEDEKMLSLDKTREWDEIKEFIKDKEAVISLKLDGLSCRLTYENGELVRAETRGDGEVGEDITHNVRTFKSVPQSISHKEKLIVEGEVICKLNDFEEFANTYKNARNFAAGSLRLLDSKECSKRKLNFYVWNIVSNISKSYKEDLEIIRKLGFQIVPYVEYCKNSDPIYGKKFAEENYFPIDGLVIRYNDNQLVKKLGETSHHKRGLLAYKFAEENYSSYLQSIEWNPSRNGRLTPVAIFNSIEIDGTTVNRASLHNLTVAQEVLGEYPYEGEHILVQKSKEIIPQIIWGEKIDSNSLNNVEVFDIPKVCPICGAATEIITTPTCAHLTCTNPKCQGSFYEQIENFVSKKGLDVKGLSKKTIEKLYSWGWLEEKVDIFRLENHKEEWIQKPGFGIASVNKILKSIEESKNVTLDKFLASLGIPLVGGNVAKEVASLFNSYDDFRTQIDDGFCFLDIDGFGEEKNTAILTFDYSEADEIAKYLTISNEKQESDDSFENQTFVITGKLINGKRSDLEMIIKSHGGKVSGSVSKKTNYLICNDKDSTTAKAVKARSLGIPIITEEEFYNLIK